LFLANGYLSPSDAQGLAVAMLMTSVAMVGTAADPHRSFYQRRFAVTPLPFAVTFHSYASAFVLLCGVGAVAVAAGTLVFSSVSTAFAGAVLFLSDKIADEVLRLRLFEKSFSPWARLLIVRSLLQLGVFAALLIAATGRLSSASAVLVLAVANLLVFVPQLPPSFRRARGLIVAAITPRRGLRVLRENTTLWMVSLSGALVSYADRLFVLIIDASRLAEFMLIVMCFSMVQLAIDFFFLSRHRADFLQNRFRVRDVLIRPDFVGCVVGGLCAGAAALVLMRAWSPAPPQVPLSYVVLAASIQAAVGATIVPREIVYWAARLPSILAIEAAFVASLVGTVVIARVAGIEDSAVLGTCAALFWIRLLMFVGLASRTDAGSRHSVANEM